MLTAAWMAAAVPPAAAQDDGGQSDAGAESVLGAGTQDAGQTAGQNVGPSTGFPLPRFASVRAGEAKLRTGPGLRYPAEWVYGFRNMPIEIVEEFEAWRKVRDWEGTEGWMHQSLLAGRRTVLVMAEETILRREPNDRAPGVARLRRGVLADLESCEGDWCALSASGFQGWAPRTALYGVLGDEEFGPE
jgi:SH3-like domain-containing protein